MRACSWARVHEQSRSEFHADASRVPGRCGSSLRAGVGRVSHRCGHLCRHALEHLHGRRARRIALRRLQPSMHVGPGCGRPIAGKLLPATATRMRTRVCTYTDIPARAPAQSSRWVKRKQSRRRCVLATESTCQSREDMLQQAKWDQHHLLYPHERCTKGWCNCIQRHATACDGMQLHVTVCESPHHAKMKKKHLLHVGGISLERRSAASNGDAAGVARTAGLARTSDGSSALYSSTLPCSF